MLLLMMVLKRVGEKGENIIVFISFQIDSLLHSLSFHWVLLCCMMLLLSELTNPLCFHHCRWVITSQTPRKWWRERLRKWMRKMREELNKGVYKCFIHYNNDIHDDMWWNCVFNNGSLVYCSFVIVLFFGWFLNFLQLS